MEARAEEEFRSKGHLRKEPSTGIEDRCGRACHYLTVCNHHRVDPGSVSSKVLIEKHHTENCPFCNTEGGIYWEEERNLPKERALRMWKNKCIASGMPVLRVLMGLVASVLQEAKALFRRRCRC